MLKIALCDDNAAELDALIKYIKGYKVSSKQKIIFECFSNGAELLSRIAAGVFYDIIFLNVVMPVINGIDVAREIYETNKVTQIVF